MVFSLFKKDPKRDKTGATPAAARKSPAPPNPRPVPSGGSSAAGGPATRLHAERKSSVKDLERQQARETSAKIDQIESEMARSLAPGLVDGPPTGNEQSNVSRMSATAPPPPGAPSSQFVEDRLEENTDTFMNRAKAIEITTLGSGPLIDEAAILFANDQTAQAEALLRGGIERHELGGAQRTGWRMLLELLNQSDDRSGFEQLAQQYGRQFGEAAPSWHMYRLPPGAAPAPVDDPVVRLPPTLDVDLVATLERLKSKAASERDLMLDARSVTRVDAAGAELLLRVLAALRRAPHRLKLYGGPALAAALRGAVQTGRRDASDACWMLRLELLRIAGQVAAFEEVAIDYCTTYEVSPPSWEPAPPNLTLAPGPAPAPAAKAAAEPAPTGPLHWVDVLRGDGMPWIGNLATEARSCKQLNVDCLHLKRIEFVAGSHLLGQAIRLQQTGGVLRFEHVNPLVAALLKALGIGEVAEIHARR